MNCAGYAFVMGRFAGVCFWMPGEPSRYLEYFVVESWAQHVRQHQRLTQEDKTIEDRVRAFHQGVGLPRVSHFIAASAVPARMNRIADEFGSVPRGGDIQGASQKVPEPPD